MNGIQEVKTLGDVPNVNHFISTEKEKKENKILAGYCQCGCGKKVKNKWSKGHNRMGVSPTNKKGHTIDGGRIFFYMPNHPNSNNKGYIRRSHLVVEKRIGRFLLPGEVVHHKNENIIDDSDSNLELLTKAEHDRLTVLVSEKCLHPGCNRIHKSRGLCIIHYNRYYREKKEMPLKPSRGNRWSAGGIT